MMATVVTAQVCLELSIPRIKNELFHCCFDTAAQ